MRHIAGFQFDHASGKGDFENFLKGISSRTGFERLQAVLIVGDNDEDPDQNFKDIRKQIGKAKFPQPNNPRQRATVPGSPQVVVLMLPFPQIGANTHGCLETLLLPAAQHHLPNQWNCVEPYCQCITGCGHNWSRTASDKMRLRCLLSGACHGDPNIALRHALRPEENLIPLTDAIFDPIATLLSRFGAWIASPHQNWSDFLVNNP